MQIIKRFRTGDIWVLICTDLMARGIFIQFINCLYCIIICLLVTSLNSRTVSSTDTSLDCSLNIVHIAFVFVMAIGIDFKGVQMVINYDLPLTAVAYIHRIGTLPNSMSTHCQQYCIYVPNISK